jgi:hypothetical protein
MMMLMIIGMKLTIIINIFTAENRIKEIDSSWIS